MRLDRTLSDTYWLDVGDPTIPITGVIEHTNMQRPETYGGAHLVYISRYLAPNNPALCHVGGGTAHRLHAAPAKDVPGL